MYKRKIAITLVIEDCKECPHVILLNNKYICCATDIVICDVMESENKSPVIPIPDGCPLIKDKEE